MSYVATTRSTAVEAEPRPARTLIRWSAVFAGAVWALAITVLLSSLWLALGFGSDISGIRDNIEWFLAGSTMLALLAGGFVAGWLPGVRGWGPGLLNGMTVWGLLLTVSLLIGVPSVIGGAAAFGGNIIGNVTGGGQAAAARASETALWAGFWTALVGFVLAAIGGALGGATPRQRAMYRQFDREPDEEQRRMEVVDERRDVPRTGTDVPRTGTDRY
jgi:putative membrane protein (TIGR04086 family)